MKHPQSWIIYCLKDPRTDEVRYVGWTAEIKEKISAHAKTRRRNALGHFVKEDPC